MAYELGPKIISPQGGHSTAASVTGAWIPVAKQTLFSIQLKWTGTTTGTMTFEVSNDENPNATTSVMGPTVLPTAFPAAGNPAGGPSSYPFDFELPWGWIRYVFTRSAGTGLLFAAIAGKGSA